MAAMASCKLTGQNNDWSQKYYVVTASMIASHLGGYFKVGRYVCNWAGFPGGGPNCR